MITKRSISIYGSITSISMETVFWGEVDLRSERVGLPWQDYVRQLLSEMEDVPNRSSATRVALFQMVKKDFESLMSARPESWWLLKTKDGSQEIGNRNIRILAGRSASNDIVVNDSEVSRKHVMLSWDGMNWWGVDLNSKNGTFYEGEKINSIKLKKGMVLHIGDSELSLLN